VTTSSSCCLTLAIIAATSPLILTRAFDASLLFVSAEATSAANDALLNNGRTGIPAYSNKSVIAF
jgi:hypothetical protein